MGWDREKFIQIYSRAFDCDGEIFAEEKKILQEKLNSELWVDLRFIPDEKVIKRHRPDPNEKSLCVGGGGDILYTLLNNEVVIYLGLYILDNIMDALFELSIKSLVRKCVQQIRGLSTKIKLKFQLGNSAQPIIAYLDTNANDTELNVVLEDVYNDIIEVGLPMKEQADMEHMMRIYEGLSADGRAIVKAKAIEERDKLEKCSRHED